MYFLLQINLLVIWKHCPLPKLDTFRYSVITKHYSHALSLGKVRARGSDIRSPKNGATSGKTNRRGHTGSSVSPFILLPRKCLDWLFREKIGWRQRTCLFDFGFVLCRVGLSNLVKLTRFRKNLVSFVCVSIVLSLNQVYLSKLSWGYFFEQTVNGTVLMTRIVFVYFKDKSGMIYCNYFSFAVDVIQIK